MDAMGLGSRPRSALQGGGGWLGLDALGGDADRGGEGAPGDGYISFQQGGQGGGGKRGGGAGGSDEASSAASLAMGGGVAAELAALRSAIAALSAQLAATPAVAVGDALRHTAPAQSAVTLLAAARQTVLQRQASGMMPVVTPSNDTPLI